LGFNGPFLHLCFFQTAASASNTELARLQVSLRNLQLQEELLREDNAQLRVQIDLAEKSRQIAKKDADSLAAMHQALLTDHDRLQNLHDLLTQDYERARLENVEMKAKIKSQREELLREDNAQLRVQIDLAEKSRQIAKKDADSLAAMHQALLTDHDRLQNLHDLLTQDYERARLENVEMKAKIKSQRPVSIGQSREIEEMRIALEQERCEKDRQLRSYADLHNEHGALKREMDQIRKENDCLSRNCDQLSSEVRKLKLAEQAQRAAVKDLMTTVEEQTKSIQAKEIEIAKLHNTIEVETLLHYNRELQEKAMSEKSVAHMEQKQFQERLAALQRHKEKLEEKIMDQYRSMESKKMVDRQKQPLVKRAAKALISRRRPSIPSGGSTTEDSSVYSADEGSPPLTNGKLRPENCAAVAHSTQTAQHSGGSAAPSPAATPTLTRSNAAAHARSSLRLPSFKKLTSFRDDTFHGAYTNPNVHKMIDMQYGANEN
ncbi:hypothetical protein OESDEN_11881, partial [Oesophagostomum dentatum]